MSRKRSNARKRAVQALYMWQLTGTDLGEVDDQCMLEHDMSAVDIPYYKELLHQVSLHLNELDALMAPLLDRPVKEVDPVEKAVMRMSIYELVYRKDIPYRVIINEGIELTKTFGGEQGHKYVNSILDRIARRLRQEEIKKASC